MAALPPAGHQRAAAPGAWGGGPRGDKGAWRTGKPREAGLGMERQVPPPPSLPVVQAEIHFLNVVLLFISIFFGSWSCSFRHVNFLTPGVSSTLDYKCLEAGDLGFCGLQIATPRQLVSAYEQKLCGPADLFVNSFSTADFCGPFAGALLKPAGPSDGCHLFYGKVTLWPDGEPVY